LELIATSESDDGSGRDCGGCTACCQGWVADEKMGLSPGNACRHLTAAGCGIYETRPEHPCRAFRCAWLRKEIGLDTSMRPDRAGVIVFGIDFEGTRVLRAIPTGEKIPEESLRKVCDAARTANRPLIFSEFVIDNGSYVGQRKGLFASPEFTRKVDINKLNS